MSAWMRERLSQHSPTEAGITLVELLVAMLLFSTLGGVLMTGLLATRNSAQASVQQHDINVEARQGLNRLTRDLRQATAVVGANNPDGAAYNANAVTSMTFTADFNGSGCIAGSSGCPDTVDNVNNPESVSYCYDPAQQQVFLIAGTLASASCSGGTQVLSGQVTQFKLSYQSNLYLWDGDGNGVTSWTELDGAPAPVGDSNNVLDTNELRNVDSVVIDMKVLEGTHSQSYRTQVDLRNRSCDTTQIAPSPGAATC